MEWRVPKMWSGDCYIIGGGSSLAHQFNVPKDIIPEEREDFLKFGSYLSSLENEHVIGVNLAAFLGDFVDIAYWGDTDTYNSYRNWFDNFGGLKVSSAGKFLDPKYTSIKHLHKTGDMGISQNPTEVSWIGKNSGASAINLAYHLGCTRILLLGFDMSSHSTGRIHWHTGYPDKAIAPTIADAKLGKLWVPREPDPKENYKRHLKGFAEVDSDAKKYGIEIINLCPDSEIKEFPKMSFEEFQKSKNFKIQVKIDGKEMGKAIKKIKSKSKKKQNIEVRCVLKTGGDYSAEYVEKLMKAVKANTTMDYSFVCLTDDPEVDFCKTIPLKHNWPGWWSKIELFRPDLENIPSVFFDLDTILMGNIDEILELGTKAPFLALRGFNQRFKPPNGINFASGIMTGNFYGYSIVYEIFKKDPEKYIKKSRFDWRHGDQGFIGGVIGFNNIKRIQDFLPNDYIIGKKAVKQNPNNLDKARILAWSGNPRLHTFKDKLSDPLLYTLNQYWGCNG